MQRPPAVTGLYWSIRGEVACDEHARAMNNPRWTMEGWSPVPMSSGPMQGSRYQCQFCAIDGRPIVHNGTTH